MNYKDLYLSNYKILTAKAMMTLMLNIAAMLSWLFFILKDLRHEYPKYIVMPKGKVINFQNEYSSKYKLFESHA